MRYLRKRQPLEPRPPRRDAAAGVVRLRPATRERRMVAVAVEEAGADAEARRRLQWKAAFLIWLASGMAAAAPAR